MSMQSTTPFTPSSSSFTEHNEVITQRDSHYGEPEVVFNVSLSQERDEVLFKGFTSSTSIITHLTYATADALQRALSNALDQWEEYNELEGYTELPSSLD